MYGCLVPCINNRQNGEKDRVGTDVNHIKEELAFSYTFFLLNSLYVWYKNTCSQ